MTTPAFPSMYTWLYTAIGEIPISRAIHGIPGLGAAQMPAYVVGQLGRGRVVAALVQMLHGNFARHLSVGPSEYITDLLAWLAEPRRGGT